MPCIMTSFIENELEPSAIYDLEYSILSSYNIFILLKTGINRGNRNRQFDLCIKGFLGRKKNTYTSYEILRVMNT